MSKTFELVNSQPAPLLATLKPPRPAINDNGFVAFVGKGSQGAQMLAAPPARWAADLGADFDPISDLHLDTAGHLVFRASRDHLAYQGIYVVKIGDHAVTTLYEVKTPAPPGGLRPPNAAEWGIGLSPKGLVAFSTIVDGQGAVMRGPVTGTTMDFVALSQWPGFYNTASLAVNDAGQVAIETEYIVPDADYPRGVLVFQASNAKGIGDIETAVGKLPNPTFLKPSINAKGQVAFWLPVAVPEQGLTRGLYIAPPVAPGQTSVLRKVLGETATLGGFLAIEVELTDVSRVLINDQGCIVFEATLSTGKTELFYIPIGRHPADTVHSVLAGAPHTFSSVQLGGLNNAGQACFRATPTGKLESQIWRVSGL
jgi:hypothetical protein